MNAFVFESLPGRVVFGSGALDQLPQEIERLGARRALVLSTPQQQGLARDIAERIGERSAGIFPQAVMHVPIERAMPVSTSSQAARQPLSPSPAARISTVISAPISPPPFGIE